MDTGDEDGFELERRNNDLMSYQSENMSSELRNGTSSNPGHTFMGLVPIGSSVEVGKGDFIGSLQCSSASVINSFVSGTWDHQPSSLQDMNCSGSNIQNYARSSNTMGIGKAGFSSFGTGIDGILDMGSNSLSSMLKGVPLLPNVAGMFLQNSTQLPADSGLIERAARFSCFNRGNFSDMMNPLVIPESMGVYSRNAESMQRAQGLFAGNCSEILSGGRSCKNDLKADEVRNAMEECPIKANRKGDLSPHDGTKLGDRLCDDEPAEGQSSGGATQGDQSGAFTESSLKELGSKKRKRNNQDAKHDKPEEVEAAKFSAENQKKVEQNSTSTSNRTIGKQVNEGPQTSVSPKGEYIHVRARRGQATNSHSLAERVRRERISERMKFLQDLVPGCNKVTGKAVMLDEIINYVQSLQRQVEFLSMKLATVNPRLDFNAEGFLANDILHPHAGPSFPLGFYPEMPIPYLPGHPTQPGLQGIGSSSDLLRRINANLTPMTGGFEKSTQLPHIWEDELHNVIQTGCESSDFPSEQEGNGTLPVHTKAEM